MKLKLCILFTLIFMITLLYVPFLRGVPYVSREALYERLQPYAVREDMVLKDESDLISAIRVKAGDYQEALYLGPSSYINVEECIIIYAPQREEQIMNKLKDLDAVAYVRFASVYREFKDVNTFFDELRKAVEKKKK